MAEVAERKKKTRGRQKIEMKLIDDKEDRVITFSKRKAGIFKKASEISVMCGAKVLFILFSPVGKAYSFGHPNVKSVADKFYGREESGGKQIRDILETHMNNRLENQVAHHQLIKREIEADSGQVSTLSDANKSQHTGWWEVNIDELNSVQEFEQMLKSIHDLQAALSHHFENLKLQNTAQGCNINPVHATYDPLGDVNKFLQMNADVQMAKWNGGDLQSVGGIGEFGNSLQGVNLAADSPAIGLGGWTISQGSCALSLPEAGFGGGLGQCSHFSLPEAGFGGGLGQGSDFNLPEACFVGGLGQGSDFNLPAAACYDATSGLANDTSGWSGIGVGYEGFSSGAVLSGATFGDHGDIAGLPGVGTSGTSFVDPGDSFYGSDFGYNFMNGLPDFP